MRKFTERNDKTFCPINIKFLDAVRGVLCRPCDLKAIATHCLWSGGLYDFVTSTVIPKVFNSLLGEGVCEDSVTSKPKPTGSIP